jgi:hypothetical protein
MALLARLRILVASYVTIGAVAYIYAELQAPLIEKGKPGGEFEGFLSERIADFDGILPVILTLLLLGITVWFVIATIQNEKTERRQVRQP